MHNIMDVVEHEITESYITGDFNIDLLKDSSSELTNTVLSLNNLYPIITMPILVNDRSASLSDNI